MLWLRSKRNLWDVKPKQDNTSYKGHEQRTFVHALHGITSRRVNGLRTSDIFV